MGPDQLASVGTMSASAQSCPNNSAPRRSRVSSCEVQIFGQVTFGQIDRPAQIGAVAGGDLRGFGHAAVAGLFEQVRQFADIQCFLPWLCSRGGCRFRLNWRAQASPHREHERQAGGVVFARRVPDPSRKRRRRWESTPPCRPISSTEVSPVRFSGRGVESPQFQLAAVDASPQNGRQGGGSMRVAVDPERADSVGGGISEKMRTVMVSPSEPMQGVREDPVASARRARCRSLVSGRRRHNHLRAS